MIDQENAAPAEVLVRSDQIAMESLAKFHKRWGFGRGFSFATLQQRLQFPGTQQLRSHPSTSFHVRRLRDNLDSRP
jgi:hypothetical protein